MTLLSISGLAIALFLFALTPGPGVFATISKALSSGFKNTVPFIKGILLGDLILFLLAIYGLAAIAETFNALFLLIRYLGSGYLIWLGIKFFRSPPGNVDTATITNSRRSSFLGGLSLTLGNPKVIIFYISFVPTFIRLDTLSTLDVVVVSLVATLVLGSVLLFYAYTASWARELFKSSNAQKKMKRTAGMAMIGTGILLLSKS
ncbi:LysE family translocator [bacterium]|nr:LysE family translocator [bacterium]